MNDTPTTEILPVTVVIPVKNEQSNLEKCLPRLKRFADVVVIDSQSTDRTKEVSVANGARVVDFYWNGLYPKKRNWFLINYAPTTPWVLFLDADELVDNRFCEALSKATRDDRYQGFWLNYTNYFLGSALLHGLPQRKLALFRVGKGLYERVEESSWSSYDMEVHEHPEIDGRLGEIQIKIAHIDDRGLSHFISKHHQYALWEAERYRDLKRTGIDNLRLTDRQKFKYKYLDRWWYPWFYFLYTYIVKKGFLDGSAGFHYAFYKAWYFHTIRLLIQESL